MTEKTYLQEKEKITLACVDVRRYKIGNQRARCPPIIRKPLKGIQKMLTINLKPLHQALIGMIGAKSDDTLRPTMNGVRFQMTGDKVSLTATDGHICSRVTLSITENDYKKVDADQAVDVILSADLLDAVKKVKAKDAHLFEVVVETECTTLNCSTNGFLQRFPNIIGTYPGVDVIISQNQSTIDSDQVLTFNAELLRDAALSLAVASDGFRKGVVGTKLHIPFKKEVNRETGETSFVVDRQSPIALTSNNGVALVMPMRL